MFCFLNRQPTPQYSNSNPAASLITSCPCGCGGSANEHNPGSSPAGSLPSPPLAATAAAIISRGGTSQPLQALLAAQTPISPAAATQHSLSLTHSVSLSSSSGAGAPPSSCLPVAGITSPPAAAVITQPTFPDSPDLSPVKLFAAAFNNSKSSVTITPSSQSSSSTSNNQLPQVPVMPSHSISPASGQGAAAAPEAPLDMSKTGSMFKQQQPQQLDSSTTASSPASGLSTVHTPPPSPPDEYNKDKFRCLYMLVDAAVGQLEKLEAAEKRQRSSGPVQPVCVG